MSASDPTSKARIKLPGDTRVAVIGLGYVGLPLAVVLSHKFETTGFDISAARIGELGEALDRTGEVSAGRLAACPLGYTGDPAEIAGADFFIVTVPTPVDGNNDPDLGPLLAACSTVGPLITKGATVVFESTVFPSATEELCGPALEKSSGMKAGEDFFLGYSPERINPGDRQHTVDRIMKIVAGQTAEVTERLAALYGAITTGGVFRAKSIMAAEAAKVIENSQRDINIAFINEITMIFGRMGLSIHDVLDAAGTKWNFLDFTPGLVGGHCISVDPYYLAHKAKELGHDPQVILAGRRTNDDMGNYIAGAISAQLEKGDRVLVLGLTFKENVPDLRNSKVIDVIRGLENAGLKVDVHDPLADSGEAKSAYDVDLLDGIPYAVKKAGQYDCVVGAVTHSVYADMGPEDFRLLLKADGLLADIKGMWRNTEMPGVLRRWQI